MSNKQYTKTISVDLPAKVNLFLHVCGRRDDGFHLLESLVGFTEFCDRLSVSSADDFIVSGEGPFAKDLPKNPDSNLVLMAARALKKEAGVTQSAKIAIEKNIPVSAGIGGGSANAAGTLRSLAELWELKYDLQRLAQVAKEIGSDIPVCVYSVPAIVEGSGEKVAPQNALPACGVVLVNAADPLPTESVFSARSGAYRKSLPWVEISSFDQLVSELTLRRNDLLETASVLSPIINDVLKTLSETQHCRYFQMSGSGGTCFGLYPSQQLAAEAARSISERNPNWWCVSTKFRSASPGLRIE